MWKPFEPSFFLELICAEAPNQFFIRPLQRAVQNTTFLWILLAEREREGNISIIFLNDYIGDLLFIFLAWPFLLSGLLCEIIERNFYFGQWVSIQFWFIDKTFICLTQSIKTILVAIPWMLFFASLARWSHSIESYILQRAKKGGFDFTLESKLYSQILKIDYDFIEQGLIEANAKAICLNY